MIELIEVLYVFDPAGEAEHTSGIFDDVEVAESFVVNQLGGKNRRENTVAIVFDTPIPDSTVCDTATILKSAS